MAVLDRCLRPSGTTYHFCESRNSTNQLHPWTSEVENATDDDQALIAMINREVEIATRKLLGGEARAAISVLRRAYRIAKGSAPQTGLAAAVSREQGTPAWRVALATVQLNMCIVLSKLGRHQQALEEARAGCITIDEVWQQMLSASAETDAAVTDGDFSKPAAPLKKLLAQPPAWLEQAVELSIQMRQALAAEAEILEAPGTVVQFHQRGMARRVMSEPSLNPASQAEASSPPSLSATVPPPLRSGGGGCAAAGGRGGGWSSEANRLHNEAVMLARHLLPEDHESRRCAERAYEDALARAAARRNPVASTVLGFTTVLPPLLRLQSRSRLPRNPNEPRRQALATASAAPAGKSRATSLSVTMSTSCPATEDGGLMGTGGTSVMADAGRSQGDVLAASLPERPREPRSKRSAEASSPKAKEPALAPAAPRSPTGEKLDPFKDWKLNVLTDTNQMNLRQMMLRTEEGQAKLQGELKRECNVFKSVLLKDYNDDTLFDARTLHTDYGMQVFVNAEKRKEKLRELMYAPTEQGLKKKAWEKELFSKYGVAYSEKKGPDVKALKKLFIASYERTPHAKAERQREEDERRRREAQEKAEKYAGLQMGIQAEGPPSKPSTS